MINFNVEMLCHTLWQLRAEEMDVRIKSVAASHYTHQSGYEIMRVEEEAPMGRIRGWLDSAKSLADTLEFSLVRHRVTLFEQKLRNPMRWSDYEAEVRALREALEGVLGFVRLYRYPNAKADVLVGIQATWAKVFTAFPSVKPEIEAGVDCYALGHNTASVFHMMRASEVGLRALARDRKITKVRRETPLEWGTWGDVIKAIEETLAITKQKTAGPHKDDDLGFYTSALSDLRALQDMYRNQTMHLRESYDESQAQTVMFRVRSLFDHLAGRINEQTLDGSD